MMQVRPHLMSSFLKARHRIVSASDLPAVPCERWRLPGRSEAAQRHSEVGCRQRVELPALGAGMV